MGRLHQKKKKSKRLCVILSLNLLIYNKMTQFYFTQSDVFTEKLVVDSSINFVSDVILLANALSIKSGLNVTITSIAQCTSDFALALYLSVMGELPEGKKCMNLVN